MADVTSGSGSSFFSPEMVSALVQMGPGIFQAFQGRKQKEEAEKMQQQLGPRVNYTIPGSATKALALSEERARPRTMAGQDQMQYMIDLENAKAFARASKAATSSQDLLGVATQLGERGQENQLSLGLKVAEDYGARQEALGRALADMAGYEENVIRDRQLDWYERARAAAAMKGASMQNQMGALQGLTKSAAGFLATDAAKKLFSGGADETTTRRQTLDKLDQMNALSSDGEEGVVNPVGHVAPGMTDKQMLEVTGMNNMGGYNYSTPTPPQLFPQSSTPFLNMGQQLGQQMYSTGVQNYNNALQSQQNPGYNAGGFFNNPTSGAIFPRNTIPSFTSPTQTLMPTTSLKDVFNMFNLYQGM
jgi:hypothetical protein